MPTLQVLSPYLLLASASSDEDARRIPATVSKGASSGPWLFQLGCGTRFGASYSLNSLPPTSIRGKPEAAI